MLIQERSKYVVDILRLSLNCNIVFGLLICVYYICLAACLVARKREPFKFTLGNSANIRRESQKSQFQAVHLNLKGSRRGINSTPAG